MTREESRQATGTTLAILRQIAALGYTVSVHRIPSSLLGTVGAFVEMHAVDLAKNPPEKQLALGWILPELNLVLTSAVRE